MEEPEWLSRLNSKTIDETPFPLADVLDGSLYYPSAGFDGDPVRYLAGNVVSFVFVDYGKSEEELTAELADPANGFRGYEVIASRRLRESELAPRGWAPSLLPTADEDPFRHHHKIKKPFCSWSILQRRQEAPITHGPQRFSLLYLCADGVAAFQALYIANNAAPRIVAVIQPGHGFGGNWTNFEDPEQIFARSVMQNPSGRPGILLNGE